MSDVILKADYTGILKLGDIEIACSVLSNGERVMAQREVIYLLTSNRKGGLKRYVTSKRVKAHMPERFADGPIEDAIESFLVVDFRLMDSRQMM
jgi:hypothetical protein